MLWAVMPAPFVMVFTAIYYRRIIPRWRKYWTTRSSLANILHGSLNGVRVVKAFAQEAREARRFDRYSANFRDAGMSVNLSTARFTPMSAGASLAAILSGCWAARPLSTPTPRAWLPKA